jgi:hypothetical protein
MDGLWMFHGWTIPYIWNPVNIQMDGGKNEFLLQPDLAIRLEQAAVC